MELINYDDKYFLFKKYKNISMVTTTANTDFGFNPKLSNYENNINFLKNKFGLSKIFTASQTHSDIVHVCDHDFTNGIEGDALITNKKGCAVGVFTADCLPIFLFDAKKQIVSAIHSGWKGVYKEIILNTINKFKEDFDSRIENIMVHIGPHNMKCCYEVGDDLKKLFIDHERFKDNPLIFNGKNLNMIECIKSSLNYAGVLNENITFSNYCTYCSQDVKFYSYRRDKESLNREFSFIFIN